MQSVADSTGYELRVLHAAADGVEPGLLLSAPGKKAEYLLNVPDGFSRLALEHKSTPSGRLSCILLTSLLPAATGGLGGLMLRLRHDGHGQVQMIGPSGTTAIVHSLRHVCRWRHPKVFVSECCGNRPFPVFEDEHIVIVPVVDGDATTPCPWCIYGASENPNLVQQKETRDLLSRACSTGGSSESTVSTEDSSDTDSSSDEDVWSNLGDSDSILPQRRKREEIPQLLPDEAYNFFKQVRLDLDKSKRDQMNVFGVLLPGEFRKKQPTGNGITGEFSVMPTLGSSTQEEEKETRDGETETGKSDVQSFRCGQQPISGLRSEDGEEVQQHSGVNSMKRFDWLIRNSQEVELPDVDEEANPVFQLSPSLGKQGTFSGIPQGTKLGPSAVLGYVCYLRKLDTAVLLVDCKSNENLESVRTHPLLRCSHRPGFSLKVGEESKPGNKHLIAAVVDLSPRNIIQSSDHKLWVETLQSCGPHVVVKGAHGEFGFQSSLATLAKLNCIHERIFPLPPCMDMCSKFTQAPSSEAVDEKVLDATLCMRLILQKSATSVDYSLCPIKLMKLEKERRHMAVASAGTGDGESVPASGIPSTPSVNGAAAAALRRNLLQRKAMNFPVNLTMKPSLQTPDSREIAGSLESFNGSEQYTLNSHRSSTTGREAVSSNELESDFQLVFFGTGCAEPSKKRGSSGILLQVKGTDRAMLMEAGEGVAGQFVRRFGVVNAAAFICSLECLWLSHKHGDHVLGVLSILEARRQQKEPLVVIGPQKVGKWLSEMKDIRAAMGCPVPEFHFIRCQDLAVSGRLLENKEDREQFDRVLSSLQMQSLRLIRVFHCFDAYGIVLRGKTGWSIVYSGDTRPCKALEYAGQGCSVLIHEATFEDELIEQARQKRHCTVSEALSAGMQMGAHHIILTHFSQRYPEMVAMCSDQNQRVSVAFDGMVVPSHLLDSLSKLLPLISSVCQKVDKTKSLISDQIIDDDHSTPTLHLRPAEADILTHPDAKELEDDGTGSAHLAVASLHSRVTRLTEEFEDCAGAKPKHIRWSGDRDDEEVEGSTANLSTADLSIKWSSDSDEEGLFQLPVLKRGTPPEVRSAQIDIEAVAPLGRGPSLEMAGEVNFDTTLSVTEASVEYDADLCHLTRRSRPRESRTVRSRSSMKMARNITRRDEIRTAVKHFLRDLGSDEGVEIAGKYDTGQGNRPLRTVEEIKAQGGKHTRWVDSDTEE